MNTQCSPFPWKSVGSNVVAGDDTLVTAVPRPKGAGASQKRDANAKLIAAAPSLLELLQRWSDQGDGIMSKGCPLAQLLADTRAEIAKATA